MSDTEPQTAGGKVLWHFTMSLDGCVPRRSPVPSRGQGPVGLCLALAFVAVAVLAVGLAVVFSERDIWWRSTRISVSLMLSERGSRASQPHSRLRIR